MSAGPNLLAWAKRIAAVADKYFDADADPFMRLARAILADEEERKNNIQTRLEPDGRAVQLEAPLSYGPFTGWSDGTNVTTKTPEPPSE